MNGDQTPTEPKAEATSKTASQGRLKISDVSRLTGVPVSTLRFWSDNGLLTPHVTPSGYRLFDETHVTQALDIKRLRTLQGLSITAVKAILATPHGAPRRVPKRAGNLIGEKLRRLREDAKLTLRQVHERTGIPLSTLASIERTSLGMQIAEGKILASFYGVTITSLMAEGVPEGTVETVTDVRGGGLLPTLGKGLRIEQLASGHNMMDCQRWYIEPGINSHGAYSHEGEEFIYVLHGQFELTLETTRTIRLSQGESMYFPSTTRHSWSNPGQTTAVVLWVNTPPTF